MPSVIEMIRPTLKFKPFPDTKFLGEAEIGEGSYGIVIKARDLSDNNRVSYLPVNNPLIISSSL